jgi:hypothetical protein
MALTHSINTTLSVRKQSEFGLIEDRTETTTIPNCIIKVLAIEGNKDELNVTVLISKDGLESRRVYSFKPDMDGTNFIKQAYLHLKTLPEFEGAVDC